VNCLHPDTTNKVCLPSEQCCLSFDGGYSCKPGGCSGTDIQAECDGPEDCTGGNRCCSQYDPNGHETEYTMCAPTCPSNTRCHNDADCAAYFPGTDNPHCSQYAGVAGNGYHNGICYSGQQNL